jgi:hypothetical protein
VGQRDRVNTGARAFLLTVASIAAVATGLTLVVSRSDGGSMGDFAVLLVLAVLASVLVSADAIRRWRRPPLLPPPDAGLMELTNRALAALDRIVHRRVELADGSTVVVGPTGVVVVAPLDPRRWETLRNILEAVRQIVADSGEQVPVRGVAVVAPGTHVPSSPVDGVTLVPPDRLADLVSRGDLLSLSTISATFDRVTRGLASDLSRVDA